MTTLVEIDTRIIPGSNSGSVVVWERSWQRRSR